MRLGRAMQRFIEQLRANGCSQNTIRSYRSDLDRLLAFHGRNGTPISALTPESLARFMNSPHAQLTPKGEERGRRALNRQRTVLRSFCRWVWQSGHLRSSPGCTLRVRAHSQPIPRLLSREEENRLVQAMAGENSALAERDCLMVEVRARVGIRVSELTGLNVCDLDLDAGMMRIRGKGWYAHREGYNVLYGDWSARWYGDPRQELLWINLFATTNYWRRAWSALCANCVQEFDYLDGTPGNDYANSDRQRAASDCLGPGIGGMS